MEQINDTTSVDVANFSIHTWIRKYRIKNEKGDLIEFKNHLFLYDIYRDPASQIVCMKAARIIHSMDGSDIYLCIEIIRRTDNKKIINQVDSNIYTTGVVLGEGGIAQAYENKAKELEKYKTDENERVKKFAERMIGSLLDSAKRERQHTDEEKQLRKIEFEG